MNKCITKKWDLVEIDIPTLCQEIEDFCNSRKVEAINTFISGRWFVVVAIFEKEGTP